MSLFERCTRFPHSRLDVLAWHLRPGTFRRLSPPWMEMDLIREAPVEEGSRTTFRVSPPRPLPGGILWTAEHRDVDERGFRDVQVEGPFAEWDHHHLFLDDGDGSLLRDRVRFRLPGGALGLLAKPLLRADLSRMFAWRHRRTADDLRFHAALRASEPRRLAIEGGGIVAEHLRLLIAGGVHEVAAADAADARLVGDSEQSWTVLGEEGEESSIELPLLLAPDPDCRRLVAQRALRWADLSASPDTRRPLPWLSLDDAAAALLHLALGREEPGLWTTAAARPADLRSLALAPLAWIGEPRQLSADARFLSPSRIPGRHGDLAALFRDALGRSP